MQGSLLLASDTPASILKYANDIWYKEYYDRLISRVGLKWPDEVHLISDSSIPRAALLACGGFDERLPAQEDYELSLRLWKMACEFKLLLDATAYELYMKPVREGCDFTPRRKNMAELKSSSAGRVPNTVRFGAAGWE